MRHKDRYGCMFEDMLGDAAQNHFSNPAMPVSAHDHKVAAVNRCLLQYHLANGLIFRINEGLGVFDRVEREIFAENIGQFGGR